ncbi:MAG: lipopolysaccharide biosynthesis protein [Thiolinea sp.]
MTSGWWRMHGWPSDMLIRHSLLYLLSHVVTALAAFLTLAAYTRWISAADYGVYSTLTALASSANVILFNWLYVGILRYWNDSRTRPDSLQGVVWGVLTGTGLLLLLLTGLVILLTGKPALPLAFCALLLSGAVFTAIQRIHSISMQAGFYLRNEMLRVVLSTALGLYLVWQGYSWYGIILATSLGFMLVPLFFTSGRSLLWQHAVRVERGLLLELLRYGLPLSITFMLLEVIHASDRVLLSQLAGLESTGQYAVAFSLPFQILVMVGSAVNMALYPHIMQTLEQQGLEATHHSLARYWLVLTGLLLPVWAGMCAVAEDFLPLLIGESFLSAALRLLPWAGLAVTLSCLYMFHTSLAFQLGKKTGQTILVVGAAAVLNILLNLWWIPVYGMDGALYASVLAYLFSVVFGHWLGRRCFFLPLPVRDTLKILVATGGMLLLLHQLPLEHGLLQGVARVLLGMLCYAACLLLLNAGHVREYLYDRCKQFQVMT